MAVVLAPGGTSYVGLSTDTKPSSPAAGSLFYETDTLATYVYDGAAWALRPDRTLLRGMGEPL